MWIQGITGINYPGTPVKTNAFIYDGDGRRTKKVDKDDTITNYFWNGTNVILETTTNNLVTGIYTHGLELVSKKVRNPTATTIAYKVYYLYDHLGNTRAITDEWGNLVNTYFYDAFGKCWNVSKDPGNKNQFVGGYGVSVDEDSGLLYMRNRYYDPSTGRFITRDPITWGPDDVRMFANPVNFTKFILESARIKRGTLTPEIIQYTDTYRYFWEQSVLFTGVTNPMLFNAYLYTSNKPVRFIDSEGFFPTPISSLTIPPPSDLGLPQTEPQIDSVRVELIEVFTVHDSGGTSYLVPYGQQYAE